MTTLTAMIRSLFNIIRNLFLIVFFGITGVIVAMILAIGGLFLLLIGRRPKVRVFHHRPNYNPNANFEFDRPPMRDVTPKNQTQIQQN